MKRLSDTEVILTTDEMLMCKHATIGRDGDAFCVPACGLCDGMLCEDVMRMSDACEYERIEPKENPCEEW